MAKPKYTVGAGRLIEIHELPVATLHRVERNFSPIEADRFVRQIAAALNACQLLIYPDLTTPGSDHLQEVIDLAREACGLRKAT